MEYQIDCLTINDSKEFHRILAETLALPEWYGHNLDALYDCLTELDGPVHLVLHNWDDSRPFSEGFRGVFLDAQTDHPDLSVTFQ